MEEERFLILVGRELSGSISPTEQLELNNMVQQNKLFAQQYNIIRQNWQAAENVGKDFDPDAHKAWQKLKGRFDAARVPVRTSVVRPLYRYLSYAASIILICAAAFLTYHLFLPSSLKVATTTGERRRLILPDHSTVWLNESSQIEYEKDFNAQNNRLVKLQGEAFFEVTKNPQKRFIVEAGNTKTQVYGPSLNVKALAIEDLQIALLEGKVAFSDLHDDWTEVLKAGEMAYMKSNGLHGKQVFTDTNFAFQLLRSSEYDYHKSRQTGSLKRQSGNTAGYLIRFCAGERNFGNTAGRIGLCTGTAIWRSKQ